MVEDEEECSESFIWTAAHGGHETRAKHHSTNIPRKGVEQGAPSQPETDVHSLSILITVAVHSKKGVGNVVHDMYVRPLTWRSVRYQ